MDAAVWCGYYGKLSCLGDFVRRNLDPGFIEPWDAWLQDTISAGKAARGENWTPDYFSAPIWRFSLAPGICGDDAMIGLLMPSVDSVGRHFPLTIACAAPVGGPWAALSAAAPALPALEAAALTTLDDHARRDAFDDALSAAAAPSARVSPDGALADRWVAGRYRRPSVWMTEIDGRQRALLHEGLPAADRAVALFDLDFSRWSGAGAEVAL